MTEVLGYLTYVLHGTDWGAAVGYSLYGSFNTTVRAAYFAFIPFFPPSAQEIAENNITLSNIQRVTEQRSTEWSATGAGYFIEQITKPEVIGLALYDSPVGKLAWMGAKLKLWSDPRAGTPPPVLNNTAILTSVSLLPHRVVFVPRLDLRAEPQWDQNCVHQSPYGCTAAV